MQSKNYYKVGKSTHIYTIFELICVSNFVCLWFSCLTTAPIIDDDGDALIPEEEHGLLFTGVTIVCPQAKLGMWQTSK